MNKSLLTGIIVAVVCVGLMVVLFGNTGSSTGNTVLEANTDTENTESGIVETKTEGTTAIIDESAEYCLEGDSYTYEVDGSSVEAVVVGFEEFKGSSYCKAFSTTTINTPAGDIITDTTYYFTDAGNDLWAVSTVYGSSVPEPYTNEVHVVDGKVVS